MKIGVLPPLILAASALWPHPMGISSVSHYSRIEVNRRGANIRYILDLAEVPTLELLQQWKADAHTAQAELDRDAERQARQWAGRLRITVDGREIPAQVETASASLRGGAGGETMRVLANLRVDSRPGALVYEDRNYPDRAGWKEIVVVKAPDVELGPASPGAADLSRELTMYPRDSVVSAPQDLYASVKWSAAGIEAANANTTPAPRGDYLANLLHKGEVSWGMMLAGMVVAFGLGAAHALSPGHGKTIVAAYLVGSRGTMKHAAFLGGMVTFTHTISVFFLGFVTLFLSQYVLPEKIYPVLGAVSGLSIVWIGLMLFVQRMRRARSGYAQHHHHPAHGHEHSHGPYTHDHGDGRVHSHMPEGEISFASLAALGASGGLAPCPSALVLLLSSVALGRVGLGLTLLIAFSFGLAAVLMAIGMVVLYAKHLLPEKQRAANSLAFRYLPVASAAIIVCAGVLMTGLALGFIRPIPGI